MNQRSSGLSQTSENKGSGVNLKLSPVVHLESGMTVIPMMHSSVPNVSGLATINMASLSQSFPVHSVAYQGGVGGSYILQNPSTLPMRVISTAGHTIPSVGLRGPPQTHTRGPPQTHNRGPLTFPVKQECFVKQECLDSEEDRIIRNLVPSLSIQKIIKSQSGQNIQENKSTEQRSGKKCGPPVKCEECGYTCSRQDRLNEHKRVVHQGVRYNCTDCDFSTPRKDKLTNHKMVVHQGIRFNCEVCNFVALRKDKLTHHLNAVHLGVRFPCEFCGFSTPRKDRLKQHVQSIHERVRYPCPICDHKAVRKDKLRDHLLIVHHGFTYKCDICSQEFKRPDKLKNHKRSQHAIENPVVAIPNPFLNIPVVSGYPTATTAVAATTAAESSSGSVGQNQQSADIPSVSIEPVPQRVSQQQVVSSAASQLPHAGGSSSHQLPPGGSSSHQLPPAGSSSHQLPPGVSSSHQLSVPLVFSQAGINSSALSMSTPSSLIQTVNTAALSLQQQQQHQQHSYLQHHLVQQQHHLLHPHLLPHQQRAANLQMAPEVQISVVTSNHR